MKSKSSETFIRSDAEWISGMLIY